MVMSFRSLLRIHEHYQVAVFFLFLCMFLVAMAMMSGNPTVTLLLFWLGLIGLGAFVLSEKIIGAVLRRVRRSPPLPRRGRSGPE
jgi:hypothetical protein